MEKVNILLSSYNGENYIEEQLTSLVAQEGVEVNITVRDDGSSDSTTKILNRWQSEGRLNWYTGANLGWAQSFMQLLYDSSDSEYYAFCDQDDIWQPNKLREAVKLLSEKSADVPSLYCSNLFFYKDGVNQGLTKKWSAQKPSLEYALLNNAATGCTMVFNKKLRDILVAYRPTELYAHDYWTYQSASIFGDVYYDPNAYILYRQHDSNQVGATKSRKEVFKKRVRSAILNKNAHFREISARRLLQTYGELIPEEKRLIIENVAFYRSSLKKKLNIIFSPKWKMGGYYDRQIIIRTIFNKL